MYIIIRWQRLKRPPWHPLKMEQVTRRLLRSLDEAVPDSPRMTFPSKSLTAQATLQATSKTTWNPMTSDQSLAGSHPLQIEKTIHNTVICKKKESRRKRPCKRPDWIYVMCDWSGLLYLWTYMTGFPLTQGNAGEMLRQVYSGRVSIALLVCTLW